VNRAQAVEQQDDGESVAIERAAYSDYGYSNPDPGHMHSLIAPQLFKAIGDFPRGTRVLDVGCGNGFICGEFLKRGCSVVGLDLSDEGVEIARRAYAQARFEVLAADDNMLLKLGEEPFDVVISTEVVEHLYAPRVYARGCYRALKPGGRFLCTTPYHGYLKNLAIAVTGKWPSHANPLWDGGHIKLWTRRSLTELLREAGFSDFHFQGIGRLPWLWMTMLMGCKRPQEQ
jgi:2-polyprenyl-3-methyl-5-hydroxy-6-metoxy-1,4-benzoquinol methylase